MPLTNDVKLTQEFDRLKKLTGMIGELFGETLSPSMDPYDFENVYVTADDKKIKLKQQQFLQQVSTVMIRIHTIQESIQKERGDIRQNELNTILDEEIKFVRPSYRRMTITQTFSGTPKRLWSDRELQPPQTISINDTVVTARYAFEVLMPKILILRQIDSLLSPALQKLDNLNKRDLASDHKDEKLIEAVDAASNMLAMAKTAREAFIQSKSVRDGLTEMEKSISNNYEINKDIFAQHRGNARINLAIDLLRGIAGYIVAVLSCPWRLYDNKGTTAYVSSYFEKRPTKSLKVFGVFKEKIEYQNLTKDAGLENLEKILNSLNPPKL